MTAAQERVCLYTSQRAYVHEQGRDRADETFTFRVSWV
jgi:hypothetical protein